MAVAPAVLPHGKTRKGRVLGRGFDVGASSPTAYSAWIRSVAAKWTDVIQASGATAGQEDENSLARLLTVAVCGS